MLAQNKIGNIINQRYKIISVLGKGGIGTTYEAQNLETQENVAIKAISLKRMTNAKQLELLEREVEVLKKLNHPGIPQYLDYFEIDSDTDIIFYIVQQLAPGKTIDEWVKQGWRVTETEVKNIATQILKILDYLHEFNPPIIHRDIKPHNLIRSPEGNIFLVDFGAVQNAYYSTFMGGSTTVGTFGYMPLEQAGGKAVPASDLYSLGATLAYLLTHRSPSELSTDGLTLDFRSHIQLSEEFADWLEKILEPEIESRFNSAKEALTALNNPKLVREGRLSKGRWLAWLGLGISSVAGVMLFYNYKWTILSGLGYPPPVGVCKEERATLDYLSTGGKFTKIQADNCIKYLSETLLYQAEYRGDKETVKFLIAQGADVNVKNNYGDTPLLLAANKGYKEIVELLITKGANVNVKNKDGDTLLFWATSNGYKEIVELLITKGANVNVKNKDGDTLLFWAARNGNKEIVELLITKGANINVKNKDGDTLLLWAASNGHKEIVELLITKGANVNVKDKDGNTLLLLAADKGNKEIVELLIVKGVYPSYVIVAEGLIPKGANFNVKKGGDTPLSMVERHGHKEIVELLITKGADVNVKDKDGNTPLLLAADKGYKEIVELLIFKGADVNVKNKDGETLLLWAVTNGYKEIVELLITEGANINVKNKDGDTPLSMAASNGYKEIVDLLITKGANINVKNNYGDTLLLFAARNGNKEIVDLLITKGANINVKNNNGDTPLLLAAWNGHKETVEFLINQGADVNAKNKNDETPLLSAERNGDKEIVEILKKYGARE